MNVFSVWFVSLMGVMGQMRQRGQRMPAAFGFNPEPAECWSGWSLRIGRVEPELWRGIFHHIIGSGSNAWVYFNGARRGRSESVCGWKPGGTTGTAGGVFIAWQARSPGGDRGREDLMLGLVQRASKESSSPGVTVGTVGGTGAAGTVAEGAANSGATSGFRQPRESPEAGATDGAAAAIAFGGVHRRN